MTGENVSGKPEQYNVVGTINGTTFTPTWYPGWTFYVQKDRTAADAAGSPTLFFPAPGLRDVDSVRFAPGNAVLIGSNGFYWVGVPYSAPYGCALTFNGGGVYPESGSYLAFGFSIRPVREQ